jgi:endonuclease YncB( thermonuclease family)
MKFNKKTALVILCGAIVAGLLFRGGHKHCVRLGSGLPETAVVKEVIDGDTIMLSNGSHVRYIGIDTPEVRKKKNKSWVYSPEAFAVEAKKYNKSLVEGKQVTLAYDVQKNDKYKRLLAYVYSGDVFVNAELIKQGYAQVYTFPPNVKYTDVFVEFQRQARKEKRGLWGSYDDKDIAPSQAHKRIGTLASVKGRVVSVYKTKKTVFLNFGKNYKTDFTVVIFAKNFKYFYDKNIDPAVYYKNKTVRIAGFIKEYNGPEIIISHPAEIEVLVQ